MRLGYLIPEFPSQTHAFFWRESKALRLLGCEIEFFSTRRPSQRAMHDFVDEASRLTTYLFPPRLLKAIGYMCGHPGWVAKCLAYVAEAEDTPMKSKARLLGLIPCAAELKMAAARMKLDHIHGHTAADGAHLLAMASIGGIPYSLTLHGDLSVYGTGHKAKFQRAKFVSVVTYDLREQVMNRIGMEESRLPMIRMGIETDAFSALSREGADPRVLRLISVSRLNPVKGHVYAIRAVRRLLDEGIACRYQIVGSGEHRPAIEAEIAEQKLGDYVSLLGSKGEKEVRELLEHSDCFLLTSYGEGEAAPVAVMEAMAAGLPCVVSIIGGTAEMIEDGVTGFLVGQKDVPAIAGAIKKLALDAKVRDEIGRSARLSAMRQFDSTESARRLLEEIRR
jgi:colanic acid/amylovoran biosynthesis glycosyltransferase